MHPPCHVDYCTIAYSVSCCCRLNSEERSKRHDLNTNCHLVGQPGKQPIANYLAPHSWSKGPASADGQQAPQNKRPVPVGVGLPKAGEDLIRHGTTCLKFNADVLTDPFNGQLLDRLASLELPECHLTAGCLFQRIWKALWT